MAAEPQTKRLTFQDLAQAVIKTWERSGFPWNEMVEGFGDSFGLGMPSLDLFTEVAMDTVEAELDGQSEAELRRLMRSRLYRKHLDFERHYEFTHGNEYYIERTNLLQLAVWSYLWSEIQRQYIEPPSIYDEEEDDAPKQLALLL